MTNHWRILRRLWWMYGLKNCSNNVWIKMAVTKKLQQYLPNSLVVYLMALNHQPECTIDMSRPRSTPRSLARSRQCHVLGLAFYRHVVSKFWTHPQSPAHVVYDQIFSQRLWRWGAPLFRAISALSNFPLSWPG